jgi:tetratricopeptide (TPR) repeat protein
MATPTSSFASLSRSAQRGFVQEHLSRADLASVWHDVLGGRMDDHLPGLPLDNCLTELFLRCSEPALFVALCAAIETCAATNAARPAAVVPALPIVPSVAFTGRARELALLGEILATGDALVTQPPALSGWGGVGKTQLAAKFAQDNKSRYPRGIFWMRADSQESLWESFLSVARQCAHECITEEEPWTTALRVCDWLAVQEGWLVIFDNADLPELTREYRERLGTRGRVLLTTRAPQVAGCQVVEVETFDPETGAELLLRRAGLATTPESQKVARELSEMLGGLALALDQAGAFVEGEGLAGLQEYVASFEKEKMIALAQRTLAYENPEERRQYQEHVNVVTTHTLALRRLEEKQEHAALQLVNLLAFLAPEGTQESILKEGAPALEEPLQSVIASSMRWKMVLKAASSVGLVQAVTEQNEQGEETLRFIQHRLTRAVLKELLKGKKRNSIASQAVVVVNYVTKNIVNIRWWEESPLLHQWIELVNVIQEELIDRQNTSFLLNGVVFFGENTSSYQESESIYRKYLNVMQRKMRLGRPDIETSLNIIVGLLQISSGYQKNQHIYDKTLKIMQDKLGLDHPDVAISLNNIALLFETTGRYEEAESFYRQALDIRLRKLGSEHPDVATSLNNLAGLLKTMERYYEAELLYVQALDIRLRRLGQEYPAVATSLNNLAELLKTMGRYEEAESLYRHALKVDIKIHGSEHPNTAIDYMNLGDLLVFTGHIQEGLSMLDHALAVMQKFFPVEHPWVQTAQEMLEDAQKKSKV